MKPGYATSEFWLALATIVAAVVLSVLNKIDGTAAMAAIGAATAGYSLSRGVAKATLPKDFTGQVL